MSLFETCIQSLRARTSYLQADFEHWRQRTGPGGDLQQHWSQTARIVDTLTGALKQSLGETPVLDPSPIPADIGLGDLPVFRRDIGSVHLLWEFFRDKFAQRDLDEFKNHLGSADDLAWACYKPCLDAAVAANTLSEDDVKEPPLVCYSAHRTPFAQARTKTFHPMGLDSKDVKVFIEVLMALPVPVIGIPWELANRVPELVLVGHEAGHVVAEDLGLASEAKSAMQDVVLENDPHGRRMETWLSWCDEVFADLFGVLATGRAFVAALGAELAADKQEIRSRRIDEQHPGDYPTPMIRMALCERALQHFDIPPSEVWRSAYADLSGDSRSYADDIDLVVEALLLRRWEKLGQKQLTEILPWGPANERNAQRVALDMLNQRRPAVAFDVRVWIAASMYAAHGNPESFTRLSIDQELANSIVGRRADAVRSTRGRSALERGGAEPTSSDEQSRMAQQQRDLEAGHKLYGLLKRLQ